MAVGTPAERYANNLSAQTTSSVFSPSSTIAAGSFLVVITSCASSLKYASSVTDSVGGNTWTADVNDQGISFSSGQIANDITTGDTITITWASASSQAVAIWAYQVSGIRTSGAYDVSEFATGVGTSISSGSTATLAIADEAVFGVSHINSEARGFTPGGTYSTSAGTEQDSGGQSRRAAYKVVAATTAVSFTGTWGGTSATWDAGVATYKGIASVDATVTVPNPAIALGDSPVAVPTLSVTGQAIASKGTMIPAPGIAVTPAIATALADAPPPVASDVQQPPYANVFIGS